MKGFRVGGAVLSLMLCLSASCLAAPVVAQGMGGSEQLAIKDAMRMAVEQRAKVAVDSRTYAQNYMAIRDSIYTHSEGYITSFDVLQRGYAGDGQYRVTIRAEVSDRLDTDVMSRTHREAMIGANMGDPRVAVLIYDHRGQEHLQAENSLIASLQESGFRRVVDLSQMEQSTKYRVANAVFQGQYSLAQSLNTQFKTDYLLLGKLSHATATNVGIEGFQGFKTGRVQLDLRLLNTSTGEVTYADSVSGTGLHLDGSMAIVEAVRNATESIHGKLSQAVMRKAANPKQHIQLILVNGVLGSGAQACQRLQELPGMGNVYLRSASYGNIVVDIDFYGTSTDLMAVLEGHGLHVLEAYSEYLKIG